MTTRTTKVDTEKSTSSSQLAPMAMPQAHEVYTPERIAEFLLNAAVTAEDYARAVEEVRKLGIDPATVPHERPPEA